MTGEPGVLSMRGIGKRFGRLAVLRDLDFQVHAGEIVGLIGANGAGKTTLLSIAAGLEPPSQGQRIYWGVPTEDLGVALRARMASVSHTAQVYTRLTALENLQLFADLRTAAGLPSAACLPLLARLGLEHAAARTAGTFSRGMLQRLALARALLGAPELLLLDEPFTALDRPGRALLAEVLASERKRGAAILLSSHDFDAIAGIADRVVLLEGGRIVGEVARRGQAEDMFHVALQRLAGSLAAVPRETPVPRD